MRIHVKLFAILREKAGKSELDLDLAAGSSIADAVKILESTQPQLAPFLNRVAFAINQTYAKVDAPLSDDDELALIPPVSGG